MEKSPIVLIIMVLCLMGAYFYYLHIKKRDAVAAGKESAEEISPPVEEAPAEKPPVPEKMPLTLKIFITLLAVYTAFMLVDSLFGAYDSLAAGGTVLLSAAFVFLPASLRLLTIALALKKKKLFRITYIAAVLISITRYVYYALSSAGTIDAGIFVILVFYAAWVVYLFRSQYIKYRYEDVDWKGFGRRNGPAKS